MTAKYLLAIETAVGNGSLSLTAHEVPHDGWSGENKLARSDQLLLIIAEFLKRNNIEKKDLSSIVVSRGPGNFTGARIGLATAFGLSNGLGIPCFGVSVLTAMTVSARTKSAVTTATLNGKNDVIRERFDIIEEEAPVSPDRKTNGNYLRKTLKEPSLLKLNDFIDEINNSELENEVVMDSHLYASVIHNFEFENDSKLARPKRKLLNAGDNLAHYLTEYTKLKIGPDNLGAIYLDYNKIYND